MLQQMMRHDSRLFTRFKRTALFELVMNGTATTTVTDGLHAVIIAVLLSFS
jgi:hypothetical protein